MYSILLRNENVFYNIIVYSVHRQNEVVVWVAQILARQVLILNKR